MSVFRVSIAFGYTFLSLFLFSTNTVVFSQSQQTDSLLSVIDNLPENKDKISSLIKLSNTYRREGDSLCLFYAREALGLSRKLSNAEYQGDALNIMALFYKYKHKDSLAMIHFDSALYYFKAGPSSQKQADVYNQKGIIAMLHKNFNRSRVYYDSAYSIYAKEKDSSYMVNVLYNTGITYEEQGNYVTALEYFFKCLALDEQTNNLQGVASDYTSIAIVFKKQGDYEQSIEYYERALEINKTLNDDIGTASALTNLGVVYKDKGDFEQSVTIQKRALEIFENKEHLYGKSIALHNLGIAYFKMGDLEQSKRYIQSSIETNKLLKNDLININNEILISRIYLQQEQPTQALGRAKKTLSLAMEIGLLEEQHEATMLISDIYENMGNYTQALEMTRRGMQLKDSVYNLEKSGQIQELQTRYETSRKEAEIELLNKEKALNESEIMRRSLQQKMTLGGLGVVFLFAFAGFRSYRFRQEQKRTLLDQQLHNEKLESERLQELDEAKSRFFANIAHEFRTPLSLILGPAEQIAEEASDQKSAEHASLIHRNANRLLSLTNQLLDLSKLESGMIKLHPVKNDFITFAKACIHSFESLAVEKDIRIIFQSELEELEMDFDPEKASIILNNLMGNALKFTGPFGNITVTVKECMQESLQCVQIVVADTGIGIPELQLPHIFDRFYQADDSSTRKVQGTGIGLALAKELTELHDGSISATSEVGIGTSFSVILPLHHENAKKGGAEPEAHLQRKDNKDWLEPGNGFDRKNLSASSFALETDINTEHTVLVVEDNAEVRQYIVEILNSFYNVIEAENGRHGLEMALEKIPDLVISDVMMPEMDGYELGKKLKSDEKTSHIPLILLTSKAGMDNKLEGLETGADDYLAKPFNARELLARIKNLIATRQKLQQKYSSTGDVSIFPGKENAFITKLKAAIEENIDKEEFGMDELGKALAMSRTQVHRKLKALTNLSTSQFIRQYKLGRALELLKTKEHNVSEVAYMLGFNTPNYFSSCFTEQYGFPPSETGK